MSKTSFCMSICVFERTCAKEWIFVCSCMCLCNVVCVYIVSMPVFECLWIFFRPIWRYYIFAWDRVFACVWLWTFDRILFCIGLELCVRCECFRMALHQPDLWFVCLKKKKLWTDQVRLLKLLHYQQEHFMINIYLFVRTELVCGSGRADVTQPLHFFFKKTIIKSYK